MHDPVTFETRLGNALGRYADLAPVTVDPVAMTRGVATGRPRASGWLGSLPARRGLVWSVVGSLVLATAAAAIVIGALLTRHAPLPGAFTPTGPMQVLKGADTAAVLGDGRVLYVGGSHNPDIPALGNVFDPRTNTFAATAGEMADHRDFSTATTLRDGRVLVAGGDNEDGTSSSLATAELFDPSTGAFQPTGRMNHARESHTATLLADGRVLVVGGASATAFSTVQLDWAEIFDPTSGHWTAVGGLSEARAGHTATLLADGRVLIAGGKRSTADGSSTYLESAEIFDPSTGTFSATSPMTTSRAGHTATLLPDGRVLIVGGATAGDDQSGERVLAGAEVYDPTTGRSSATGSLATARRGHSATLLLDGRVLVAGGANRYGDARSTELYDPSTGTFEQAAWTLTGVDGPAARLADGRVLLPGQVFDPTSSTPVAAAAPRPDRSFVAAGDPVQDRSGHTATRLRDGRVLIVGGTTPGGGDLASAEVYDPKTGAFAATGSMAGTRSGHAAFLLDDGRVLLIGGFVDGHPSTSVEVYDPATGRFSTPRPSPGDPPLNGILRPVQLADHQVIVFGPGAPNLAIAIELDADQLRTRSVGYVVGCAGRAMGMGLPDGRVMTDCSTTADRWLGLFDPTTGATTKLDVPADDVSMSKLALADGRVLLYPLGAGASSGGPDMVVLDPRTGQTAVSGSLAGIQDDVTATLLADGRAFFVGGNGAIVWDPATAVSTTLPGPLTTLEGQTATLLDDGRVLIVGGTRWPADAGVAHPPGAELFDPKAAP